MRGQRTPMLKGWFLVGLIAVEVLHLRQLIALLAWLLDQVGAGLVRLSLMIYPEQEGGA